MNLEVKNGIVEAAKIYGDFFSETGISEIEDALINTLHEEGELRRKLSSFQIEKHFRNISLDELMTAMF